MRPAAALAKGFGSSPSPVGRRATVRDFPRMPQRARGEAHRSEAKVRGALPPQYPGPQAVCRPDAIPTYQPPRPDTMQYLAHLFPPILAALLIASGWLALHAISPAVPSTIHGLLTGHPWLVGFWLVLSVIGLDYALTAARNAVGFRNVGSKALAHFRLKGRQ